MGKAGIIAKLGKALGSVGAKMGILAGSTTFFGLEWATNGGIVRSAAGTLGIPDWAASVALCAGVLFVGYLVYLRYKGTKRTPARR